MRILLLLLKYHHAPSLPHVFVFLYLVLTRLDCKFLNLFLKERDLGQKGQSRLSGDTNVAIGYLPRNSLMQELRKIAGTSSLPEAQRQAHGLKGCGKRGKALD